MSDKLLKLNSSSVIYLLCLAIYCSVCLLNYTSLYVYSNSFFMPISIICIVILPLSDILLKGFSARKLFVLLLFCALCTFFVNSSQIEYVVLLVFIYSGLSVDFKQICNVCFVVSSLILLFVILLAKFDVIYSHSANAWDGSVVEWLGFRYSLYPSALFLNILFIIVFLYRDKCSFLCIAISLAVTLYLFSATKAKLSFFLSIFCIVYMIFVKFIHNHNSVLLSRILKYAVVLYPLVSLFSIACIIFYSPSNRILNFINSFFEQRLLLGHESYMRYGVDWIGVEVEWRGGAVDLFGNRESSQEYLTVDNIYFRILQLFGFIVLLAYIFYMTVLSFLSYKYADYVLLLILSLICIKGFIDDLSLHLFFNTFWLSFSSFYKKFLNKDYVISKKCNTELSMGNAQSVAHFS